MRRIPSLAVHHPWLTVLGWLCFVALVGVGGRIVHPPASSPSFLPAGAESQRAAAVDGAKFTGGHQSAQLVISDSSGLRASDQVIAGQLGDWLRGRPKSADIVSVGPAQPSPDDRALVMKVTFGSTGPAPDGPDARIASIDQHMAGLRLPPGVSVALTGDLAISNDVNAGISGSGSSGRSDLFRALSVLVVVIVLALVYRAPLAVLVPLCSIGLVLTASAPLLNVAAATVGLPTSSNSLPFVFVVILGAGTNYGLFLISRYREELRRGNDRVAALDAAARGVAPAITASAATVVLGTAAMGFTSLGFFRTLGPAVAASIVVMLAAGLTLTPALIAITKGAFFWPRWPRPAGPAGDIGSPVWSRVGALVTRRPAVVLVVVTAFLAAPVLTLATLHISVDTLSELPGGSPSLTGYRLIQAHFPVQNQAASLLVTTGGSRLQPDAAPLSQLRESLRGVPGVASVGGPAVSSDGTAARFDLGFSDEPSSEAAAATLTAAETAATRSLATSHFDHVQVLAGGEVATDRDLRQLLALDFMRVTVLVGLAIYLVIAILLRNLLAPVYLLASVGLSTAAAIGGVGMLYLQVADQPLYWAVPVFAFVFLVALGEDFNIYLVSRMREQLGGSEGPGPIARAIALSGGVISSAGLVMAAAFFLFLGNPVPLVQQLGAVVVVGLLLDTFVVRPFLVPALVQLLGRRSGISTRRRDGPAVEASAA
jgi:putative drug exporter of the RND superfamily